MNIAHNLPESISPGKSIATKKKLSADSPRRRRLEGADRVLFWEHCLKKSGKFTTGIMKTEQAVIWTELLS